MSNTTDLAPQEAFQEQIKARVRAAVGELMPDEMLKKIVEEGLHAAFFERPHKIKYSTYGSSQELENDPWFTVFIREEMSKRVQQTMDKWIAEHPDEIRQIIRDVTSAGMAGVVFRVIADQFSPAMYDFRTQMENIIRNLTATPSPQR